MTTIHWFLFLLVSFCAVVQAWRASYWKAHYVSLRAFVERLNRLREYDKEHE